MAIEIKLPQLAESMVEGALTKWFKREGERVVQGEALAEIETDKSSVDVESPASGMIQRILVQAGTANVKVGEVLAYIDTTSPVDNAEGTCEPTSVRRAVEAAGHHATTGEPVRLTDSSAGIGSANVTPLAQRMAEIAGVDLGQVIGTGAGGRIGKADIEAALGYTRTTLERVIPVTSESPAKSTASVEYEERPHTAMRRAIAARLTAAKRTIPHFYLQVTCAVDELLAVKGRLNSGSAESHITMTDIAVWAAASTLRVVPDVNCSWTADATRFYRSADVGFAVAVPGGLVVPVIRSADRKSVGAISRETKSLTEQARNGTLRLDQYAGGTFTISNLGMFGIESLYPIINPPQSAILGIGSVEQRPVVKDNAIAIGATITCTLSVDHRAVDGATAAEWLGEFKRLIEDPSSMSV